MAEELDNLSDRQLKRLAARLGVRKCDLMTRAQLIAHIQNRRRILDGTSPEELAGILEALGVPVETSWDKDRLAAFFYKQLCADTQRLSEAQLRRAAQLHEVDFDDETPHNELARRLASAAGRRVGFMGRVTRRAAHSLLDKFISADELLEDVETEQKPAGHDPDEVLGRKLKVGFKKAIGYAADDYIGQKLDEIERRIDVKLEDIDRKMDAWRTKEVRHRLRILRITIIAGCLVAVLSLIYSIVKTFVLG